MRITIVAIGSRGDVQPMLALAAGLQQTGRHKIRFAAPDNFEALTREHNLDFFPLGLDAQALMGAGELKAGVESGYYYILQFMLGNSRSPYNPLSTTHPACHYSLRPPRIIEK